MDKGTSLTLADCALDKQKNQSVVMELRGSPRGGKAGTVLNPDPLALV